MIKDYDFNKLSMSNDQVASLNDEQARLRLDNLIKEAYDIYNFGIQKFIYNDKKILSNTCILFSGGNDSTILFYLFKDIADFAIHINTGIGIPETYMYIQDTCKKFDVPLKVYKSNDDDSYENLVKNFGFPGPAQHFLMYQRLKERALRKAVKENNVPKKERIVFLSGKRRDESLRRMLSPEFVRNRSVVWISPIVNWTKSDINLYRKINNDIPRNPVSDMLHMSGECMCGSFAKVGERDQVAFFFPNFIRYIESLEGEVQKNNNIAKERMSWGWGVDRKNRKRNIKKINDLCSTCEYNNLDN